MTSRVYLQLEHNDQLLVNFLAQLVEPWTDITEVTGLKSRSGLIFFFRPYFHYCLRSVHYFEDHFHIHCWDCFYAIMSGFVATNVEYSSEVFKWLYSKAHYRCLQAVALDSYQTVFKQLSSGLHHRCWSACLKPFLSGLSAVASWWSRRECASEPFFCGYYLLQEAKPHELSR